MGGLLNSTKMMVSILHKELESEVKNYKYNFRTWRSCSQGSKRNPIFQLVNLPAWISCPHKVLQLLLINTVFHVLVNNNKGEGGGLNNSLLLKARAY